MVVVVGNRKHSIKNCKKYCRVDCSRPNKRDLVSSPSSSFRLNASEGQTVKSEELRTLKSSSLYLSLTISAQTLLILLLFRLIAFEDQNVKSEKQRQLKTSLSALSLMARSLLRNKSKSTHTRDPSRPKQLIYKFKFKKFVLESFLSYSCWWTHLFWGQIQRSL